MYLEFIIIYAMLGVIVFLLLVTIILLILVLKKSSKRTSIRDGSIAVWQKGSVVLCKNCATEFSAKLNRCPKCGTIR